jgi:hypothetical protein
MVTLADALTTQRQKRELEYKELMFQWQLAQNVLQALGERLAATQLPRWYFIPNGEEIAVVHQPSSTATKERIGAWYVDEQYRLTFGEEKTEWITKESWRRVIDKAVVMTADVILDRETQLIGAEPALLARTGNEQSQWQPSKAS